MKYRITDISKMLDIPTSTLRYYDNQGLFPNLNKSKSGVRIFEEKDIEILYSINCLKKSGMSINQIKKFLLLVEKGDSSINQRYEMLLIQKENMLNQMNELKEVLDYLDYKIWYYETAKKDGTTSKLVNLKSEEIPSNFICTKERIEIKKENYNSNNK